MTKLIPIKVLGMKLIRLKYHFGHIVWNLFHFSQYTFNYLNLVYVLLLDLKFSYYN